MKTLLLIAALFSSYSIAYTENSSLVGVYFPPGVAVEFDFYDAQCLGYQDQIVQGIEYTVRELNRIDPDRDYAYIGTRANSQWGSWDRTVGDVLITLECAYPSQMAGALDGQAVPISNCPAGATMHVCADGSARHIVDGGVLISNQINPSYRPVVTTIHEIEHTMGIGHSRQAGSTMNYGASTELSSQMQETWGRDDWCAIREKIPNMVEWPIMMPSIDDAFNLHVPAVLFLGQVWELVMLYDGAGGFSVALSAQVMQDCSDLED